MKLSELIQPELVFLDVLARSRDELIEVLASRLADADDRFEFGSLREGLMEREALGGTVVGGGIILPHARVALPGEEMVAFARLKEPLDLGAPDQEPIWLAAISVTDPDRPGRHLQILSQLAKLLHQEKILAVIKGADSCQLIADTLIENLRERPKQFQLLVAILPDDEAVHDYLNLLAGIGVQGATSLTGRGMAEILSSGPTLFAGFRELFGAVGGARLVFSALDQELLQPALDLFNKFREKRGISGVAFHLPLSGVVGLERQDT